ncbi:MAG TPA: VOC family protein [Anaerolineaceae bacterium]|nr:VOC family protein [Anaerolineaceae bacterium]
MDVTIHPATHVGALALTVSNLERALDFYTRTIGFTRLNGDPAAKSAVVGVDQVPLLHLTEQPGARRPANTTGLYHFAIRLPNRLALARVVYHLAEVNAPIQGVADHGVSEAVYLADPDRNGIEIYRDRPEDDWPVDDQDQIMMYTDPLDVEDLLGELSGQQAAEPQLPAGTVIGHVHLHVADLEQADAFYRGVLGLDLMQRYGEQALFFSAGGYHHHVGVNTWAGQGAPPPPPDSVGLRWFELRLPDEEALNAVLDRLRTAGRPVEPHPRGHLTHDPSQNGVLLSAA